METEKEKGRQIEREREREGKDCGLIYYLVGNPLIAWFSDTK